nr:threonine dehydratase biosynthetic, chloroplastic [Quercus suber]
MEEKLWQQRAHDHWMVSGDKNTGYFHNRASQKFRRNSITELRGSNGEMVLGEDEITALVVGYYKNLFSSSTPGNIEDVVQHTQQVVFSFKLRGAYNMMAKLSREQLRKGVICCSAGNHAQGVALSAQKLGVDAVVAMPTTTPEIKVDSLFPLYIYLKTVERLGATVVLVGESYAEAQEYAKHRAKEEGRTFVPGFDHPDIIAGQGTVGMEIVRQLRAPLHAIFVPVGGGGLIAGIAAYVKSVSPEVKIIGVEPYDANSMALSLYHGQRIVLDKMRNFAEGVAIEEVGEETFRLCRELIDGVVLVSHDAICASIKLSL